MPSWRGVVFSFRIPLSRRWLYRNKPVFLELSCIMYYRDFHDYLADSRRLSFATIKMYFEALKSFHVWYCSKDPRGVLFVQPRDVYEFMAECSKRGMKAASINQYLTAIGRYYGFLQKFRPDAGISVNPVAGVERMRVPRVLPVCIPEKPLRAFLESLPHDTFKQSRSRAILYIMYFCGLRRSEVVSLRDDSFDFSRFTVRVWGKGSKERLVPFSAALEEVLSDYLDKRRVMFPSCGEWFFVSAHGEQLGRDDLSYLVRVHLSSRFPAALCHPHILRHSFATTLINHGVDIMSVSSLMGHSDVSTTMRYITVSSDSVHRKMEGVF